MTDPSLTIGFLIRDISVAFVVEILAEIRLFKEGLSVNIALKRAFPSICFLVPKIAMKILFGTLANPLYLDKLLLNGIEAISVYFFPLKNNDPSVKALILPERTPAFKVALLLVPIGVLAFSLKNL